MGDFARVCTDICCRNHTAPLELTRDEKLSLLLQLGEELHSDSITSRVREVKASPSAPPSTTAEEDLCPLDFDPGQQLLPRTAVKYRAPFADLFLLLNAVLFDNLGAWFYGGIVRVRETRLVLTREPLADAAAAATASASAAGAIAKAQRKQSPLLFRPVLAPRQASKLDYEGSGWSNTLASYRLTAILLILLLINLGAWVITLVTIGLNTSQGNPFNVIWAWQFNALEDIARSVLEGVPTLLALSLWAIVASVISVLFYWLHVTSKAPSTRCLRGNVGLASVLPLCLTPRAPLVMVSYPWVEGHLDVARSLASCLPNAWIDVQMLVPGSNVPRITAGVSRWTYCLIICLSPEYLMRNACVLEFVTAVLERKWYQKTIAFLPEGTALSQRAREMVEQLGVRVYSDPRALLKYLDAHIYACSVAEDQHNCTAWFGRVSSVRCDAPRGLRLPAPKVASTHVPIWGCDRLLPPTHAICAGRHYLSADGTSMGTYCAYSMEQCSLLLALLFTLFSAGCLGGAYWQLWLTRKEEMRLSTVLGLPATALAIVILLVSSTVPLRVDLGFLNHHSNVLLPLNIAAFCNHLRDPKKRVYDKSVLNCCTQLSLLQGKIKEGADKVVSVATDVAVTVAAAVDTAVRRRQSFGGGGAWRDAASPKAATPAPAAAESLLFSIAFLIPEGGMVSGRGGEIPGLMAAVANISKFLNLMGLAAEVYRMDGGEQEREALEKATLFVFVLPTVAAAEAWHARWREVVPTGRCVLVVTEDLLDSAPFVRDYMVRVFFARSATSLPFLSTPLCHAHALPPPLFSAPPHPPPALVPPRAPAHTPGRSKWPEPQVLLRQRGPGCGNFGCAGRQGGASIFGAREGLAQAGRE